MILRLDTISCLLRILLGCVVSKRRCISMKSPMSLWICWRSGEVKDPWAGELDCCDGKMETCWRKLS